jgi:hypothetical protein
MFSKPIREYEEIYNNPKKNILKENKKMEILNYKEFYEKKISLKKYKLPELKEIIKQYKLPRTGNKDILIERIECYFKKIKNSITIQKIFRGWMVRYSFNLRGEAFKNRKLCVNDTDFISLEPLDEIEYEQFYSYKDNSNFIYGFNISSLIQLLKNKGKINNPYNRELLDYKNLNEIVSLNNIIQIIFPLFKEEKCQFRIEQPRNTQPQNNNRLANVHINPTILNLLSNSYFSPRVENISLLTPDIRSKYNRLLQIRLKPINIRIQELFMEIDHLGNYTQSSWFLNLNRRDCIRLYRSIYDIWSYRGQLSSEVKLKICPLFEPFTNIFSRQIYHTDILEEQIQFICLTVIENIIYTGVDDEFRKIGALHFLSALTIVSQEARNAMPWLYESVAY